jgi:hypothetical protein
MSTYIYSKWKNSPTGSPVEFYSELDGLRYETRKVEVFHGGRFGYASKTKGNNETKLGIIPVPPLSEIMSQSEFDIKAIKKEDFESIWEKAVS